MIRTNIAIVGAGPAGSICAIMLQRAGVECLLIDKAEFPRDKLCGGGLPSHAWKMLETILPDFKYEYRLMSDVTICYDTKPMGKYSLKRPLRIVKRKDFDHLLVQEYLRLGGKMLHETVYTVEEISDGMQINMRSGETVICNHIVGADGSNSRVRKFLQPDFHSDVLCLEQYEPYAPGREPELLLDVSPKYNSGYYYEFPTTDYVAVGYGDYKTSIETFRQILSAHKFKERKILGAMITISQDYPQHNRVTLIGDAGGWVDNVTFEGLHYAIATGHNAAQAIINGVPFSTVNKEIEKKKKHKKFEASVAYTRFGMWAIKNILRSKKITEWILNKYLD